MKRRDFLSSALAGSPLARAARQKELPRRPFRDDVQLSIIGFGGIVVVGLEQKEADRLVAASVDRGVNYFDVAPSYWDGEAETKLGHALKPYRSRVFLAEKTTQRTAAGALAELETSLRRLGTDHVDLYQFHAVTTMEDVEGITAPGGAAEAFLKAKRDGKLRYIGFSAHSVPAALALMDRLELDSILFPVNFVCWSRGNFGPQVLARAKEKGVARLALKAMAYSVLPQGAQRTHPKCWYRPVTQRSLAEQALRFTLSEDITAAIPPGDEKLYQMALELAAGFRPLVEAERQALFEASSGVEPIFRA